MKRLIAAALAMLLALGSASSALAAPLLEKFQGQMKEQGFKGTVSFSASGDQTEAFGDDLWAWLKSAAPRVTLETNHSFANRSDGQATLDVLIDGQAEGKSALLYNSDMMGFSSDFLGGYDTAWYTASRNWNALRLLQPLTRNSSEWPPVWGLLLAVDGASAEWKEKAGQHFVKYETKLGEWINGYAQLSTVTENKRTYTQLQCLIPAQQMKAEIKQLLVDFFNDQSLLSLLREIASAQEAASYLQPGMQEMFFRMLDQLKIEGSIEIIRRYDGNGKAVMDQISLPFAESQLLKELTIAVLPDGAGQTWTFTGQTRSGVTFDISCAASGDTIYSGSVTVLIPAKADTAPGRFLIVETTSDRHKIAFDYNATWDAGKEEYSLANDRFTQTIRGTLLIKPHDALLPDQSLALEAQFSSASSERSSTRLEASLLWTDQESGASLSVALSGRTAAPGTVTLVSEVKNAARVDLMPSAAYASLAESWKEKAESWLRGAADLLLPSALPQSEAPSPEN